MPPETATAPVDETTPAATPDPAAAETKAPAAPVPAPGAVPPPPVKSVVPDKYELKLPETDAMLDAPALERIAVYAKAQGLTQEAAQQALEHTNAEVSAYVKTQQATFAKTTKAWLDVVKADPEIGGTHFDQTIKHSMLAIDRFATPDFKKALNDTGFGNHPELVRVFAKIGKAMAEDGVIRPGAGANGPPKSMEETFYGDTPTTN